MQILQKVYSADQEHSTPKSDFSGLGSGEGSDFVTLLQCNLARKVVFFFLVSLLQASLHFQNKCFTRKKDTKLSAIQLFVVFGQWPEQA